MSTTSNTYTPTLYKDDSDPKHILLILNSDPRQLAPPTTPQPPSITAHRFRQILIVPDESDIETEHISLMPVLTYTTERNRSTSCRPQVIARLRRPNAKSSAGETDLLTRFLGVWSETPGSRSTTIKAETGGAILAAIRDVELLAARVGQIYSKEATIYDSDNAADQGAFKDEWYGSKRYLRCTSPKAFALTDLTRPVGIFSENRLRYLDILDTESNTETGEVRIFTSSRYIPNTLGQKVLYRYVAKHARAAHIVSTLEGILNCNADIDASDASGPSAMRERNRLDEEPSAVERGPLNVPLECLSETFDTLQNLFAKETEVVVDIGIPNFNNKLQQAAEPILDTTTVLRPQLRPVNLLHLRDTDVVPYLTDKTLSFFIV